ncbi:MAG: uncharacterized protein PWR09_361 [Archaeoglobi archaeon]|nr:uncharacterized protein [Archaeoglobi archaeon]
MRFIDSNVFLYAMIRPKENTSEEVLNRKERAKKILLRVENGEEVATTLIHLSEIANILEAKVNLTAAARFLENLLLAKNVKILPVSVEDYLRAVLISKEKGISVNDALAYLKMREFNIKEIYTFDRHFQKLDVDVIQE